jgi:NADH dehydrogenase FAD-containing subunit
MDNIQPTQSRRSFLRKCALVAGGSAAVSMSRLGSTAPAQAAAVIGGKGLAKLPKAKGPRLVIVGAGTSGLTIARHAKRAHPRFDVVVVDKQYMYCSCFTSNLWYDNLINLEFRADYSFLDAARNHNFIYFSATATGLDRSAHKLYTNMGEIPYDFLVVAPGIDYDYARIGVKEPEVEYALRTSYPGGFTMPTEHVAIRDKIHSFEGGVFVQTVPAGNYRCLPAPYERACMIASWFKQKGIKGKVLVLDANPEITIKAKGFHAAFDELYKDIIEYKPSVEIKAVDPDKRLIKTEFTSYTFDDASIYPGVRAATLIEQMGLLDPESLQKEARIDPYYYNVPGDEHVYVTGDARPMPYSKSANTANSEGAYVAKVLAARAQGKKIPWESPETLCYSMVNGSPTQAIAVDAHYAYDKKTRSFQFANVKLFEQRDHAMAEAYLEWAKGLYRDMFA